MELKKSEKADLENKKNVFLLIGLVAALGITLLAFEWTTKPAELASLGTLDASAVEEEVIPITRQEEMKTPPRRHRRPLSRYSILWTTMHR